MPKRARELSAIEVKRLTSRGYHAVGGVAGLLLQITKNGARSWILRYRLGGKRRDMGLGPLPDVSLARAREQAREAREQIVQGIDPVAARRDARAARFAERSKALTFDEAAKKYLTNKTLEFSNPKHAAQWSATLATYASPVIGALPVDKIELAHIVELLNRDALWTTKPETASRVRGRIESVLAWATVSGYRTGDNPARWRGHLDAVLPRPSKIKRVQHHRALPVDAAPAFLAALRAREGMGTRALEFIALTAARSGEVRGACWSEIDLQARTWTIPGERMKAGKEHVVPLCDDAVVLLEALPTFEGCPYVFPSARNGMLSDVTLSATMKRMGIDAVPHGLRSTFRDWCAERTSHPREVAEAALAHTIGNKVEAAYRRTDLLAKRRRMMTEWAKFLNTPAAGGVVVPIRGVKT
jgi:integrase